MSSDGASLKPIFLLADSQVLFWRERNRPFLARVSDALEVEPDRARAAYLGASNGDAPEYFEIFRAAFGEIGVSDCMHIRAEPDGRALSFLREASVVLLAGGDVEIGWRALERSGLAELVRKRWTEGAVVMGVSAGAVQLGLRSTESSGTLKLLSLVPYLVGAHQEPEWEALRSSVSDAGPYAVGIGIPTGGGAIMYPDLSIAPVRRPLSEVRFDNGAIKIRDLLAAEAEPSRHPALLN